LKPDWPSLTGPKAFDMRRPSSVSDCSAHCMVATIAARS
jgi:hypothetical protein